MSPEIFWIPGPWRGVSPSWHDRAAAIGLKMRHLRGGDRGSTWPYPCSKETRPPSCRWEAKSRRRSVTESLIVFSHSRSGGAGINGGDAVLIGALSKDLSNGLNVRIHCRQSVGRSGLVAAALLAASGAGVEEAVEKVSRARGVEIPETRQQRDWLFQFPAELAPVEG